MSEKSDDFDAVRAVVAALKDFDASDQERIIRWACEKLSLTAPKFRGELSDPISPPATAPSVAAAAKGNAQVQDIRSFISSKSPQSDREFTAAVAYFYRFVAPADERKDSISATDLQDACRKADRERLSRPSQTLVNAHHAGLLDNTGRGEYSINAVGENLVSMTLPRESGARASVSVTHKRASRPRKKGGKSRVKR